MWIVHPEIGFLSIVQKPYDKRLGTLTVRARRREDLIAFGKVAGPLGPIGEDALADYRFRARLNAGDVAAGVARLAAGIAYDNVKHASPTDRQGVYMQVWAALARLQPAVGGWDTLPLFDGWLRATAEDSARPARRPHSRRKARRSRRRR